MVGKTSKAAERRGNEEYVNRPPQPTVPNLNIEVTIPLKYLSNV